MDSSATTKKVQRSSVSEYHITLQVSTRKHVRRDDEQRNDVRGDVHQEVNGLMQTS